MCSRKWLIVALVACGLASACSQYNTNLSIQTSSSVLTYLSPSTAPAGGQGFTITANGGGFISGALILWNGTALTTTYVNPNQLTAPVPASSLSTVGTVQVSIEIPGSAQSATTIGNTTTTAISNAVLFTVIPPPGTPPSITSLSASTTSAASTPYCSTQGFTLTVNGTNFTSDAVVNWNGVAQPTTFSSATPTQLTATISAAEAAFPGSPVVSVTNSVGVSNGLPFTLTTPAALPAPGISTLSQTSASAGSPAQTLTVTGTNILPCSVVQWISPGSSTPTTLLTTNVSATQLTATVPPADFLTAGTAKVLVSTSGPGGGASPTSISFTIAAPSISSLSSSASTVLNTTASCTPSGFILTVNGANFVNGSVVDWNGSARVTSFVSATQLTATISASDIASAGTASITVSNSGVSSAPASFTISAASSLAVPTITSISQVRATAGTAGFPLSVVGTNFLPCSAVQWTNAANLTTALPTTYVSPTQLSATVPAVDIAALGSAKVSVASPAFSANTTNPSISFLIVPSAITSLSASTTALASTPYCASSGLTLTVNGTDFADGLVVNWNGSPRPTTYVSATQLTAAITASDTAFLATGQAAVAITVSSGSAATSHSAKFALTALPTGSTFPAPILNSTSPISPASAAVETVAGPPVPLTVNGSGFAPCSFVEWNGSPLPTSIFVGTSGMTSLIPALNVSAVGTDRVAMSTPTPGGGTSGNAPFTVYTPTSPTTPAAGSPGGVLSLPLMSANRRYGVYVLASTDGAIEVAGSTQNIFVDDTCLGVASGCTPSTTLVSVTASGAANGDSISPSINADSTPNNTVDGRYVAFLSSATNLMSTVTNGLMSAYVRDTCAGVASGCTPSTQLVSVSTGGTQANGPTTSATIDGTGRYITFASSASNLGSMSVSGGMFLRDTCAGVASGCTPSTQPWQ